MKEQNTSVSPYKYKDKFLSGEIVSELILETFDKQLRVSRQEIVKKVKELHRSRGGLLNSAPKDYTAIAYGLDLLRLAYPPKAYNQPKGFWHINSTGVDTDSPKYRLYGQRVLKSR